MNIDTYITDPISIIYDLREWLDYNITQSEGNLHTYAKPRQTRIYEQLAAFRTTLDKLDDLIDENSI